MIPTQKGRKERREVVPHPSRERNVCERSRSRAKQYRRATTRYEERAANDLASVKVAAMLVTLQHPGLRRRHAALGLRPCVTGGVELLSKPSEGSMLLV